MKIKFSSFRTKGKDVVIWGNDFEKDEGFYYGCAFQGNPAPVMTPYPTQEKAAQMARRTIKVYGTLYNQPEGVPND